MSKSPLLEVDAVSFYEQNIGFTLTWMRAPNQRVTATTYYHVEDASAPAPVYLEEVAVMRALQIVLSFLESNPTTKVPVIRVKAG